ncbi:membrane bound O-acyl transferase family-domain-containing protein [Hypoxylon sp. FL0890]|nr:membrane bound O-acyl transferase family-domain-containing protein [Hypoxylon sp. FL0890]
MFNAITNFLSQYPRLDERDPLPPQQLPIALIVVVLGYFVGPGILQMWGVSYILLLLGAFRPYFTTGDVVTDYTQSSLFFVLLLSYLDHGIKTKNSPRYVGRSDKPLPNGGIGERGSKTWMEKLKWSLRLATTPRGIGWNWQVKNVPSHPGANQPRLEFVRDRVVELAWRMALKALVVYIVGFCQAVQPSVTSPVTNWLFDAVVGWCGAAWSWHIIGIAHAAGGAITVLLGICEPWEWPPVVGRLGDAWSVRQAWSTTYHQTMRRTFQTPGVRLARFLSLKQGTLGSRYVQLYIAFFISFCVHGWQSFTTTRRDNGEFAFFVSQPVIITIEDFVRWIWQKSVNPRQREKLAWLETLVGYVWTIIAFTVTLRPIMKGWTGIGLIGGGGPDEKAALQLGRQHGAVYLRTWQHLFA